MASFPYVDSGLSAATNYSYRAIAIDNNTAQTPSLPSAVTSATTQAGSGATPLKTFLTNNTTLINGGAFNIYGAFGGSGPYGNGLQGIQTGTTAANSVIVDPTTGVSTGLSMAHLNIQTYQFFGPCTVAQSLALGADWQNAGGILTLTVAPPNPVYGTGTPQLAGTNAFQSGNSVIVPGNAAYNTFHNGPYNCGYITCPNGLQSIAAFIKSLPKTVIVRVFHEMNLTGSNSWWVSNFCTPAQFQTLFKQFVLAMDASGVTNALYEICINWAGNNASWQKYIPAADSSRPQGYFDIMAFDYYYAGIDNIGNDLNGTFSNALQSYGKPVVMGETGCGGPTPIPAQSQDNSLYGASFHSACPWVKMLAFYAQGWQLESQKGATALMQQTTSRSQLPTLS